MVSCWYYIIQLFGWLVGFLQHDILFLQEDKEGQTWNFPDPKQEYEAILLGLMNISKLELKTKHTEE